MLKSANSACHVKVCELSLSCLRLVCKIHQNNNELDELIIMVQILGLEGVKSGPVTACCLVEAWAHYSGRMLCWSVS